MTREERVGNRDGEMDAEMRKGEKARFISTFSQKGSGNANPTLIEPNPKHASEGSRKEKITNFCKSATFLAYDSSCVSAIRHKNE